MDERESIEAGHETADVPVRPLLIAIGALLLGCAGAFWLMRVLFDRFEAQTVASEPRPHPMAATRPLPEGPRLQASSTQDMRAFATRENEALESYGWIDRQAGVVRLPVERALELLLREGLPTRVEPREEER